MKKNVKEKIDDKILILRYKKCIRNKDVSSFVKYFCTDQKKIAEFLSETKNDLSETEMELIIDVLSKFNNIDSNIINEFETIDESQRNKIINILIRLKEYKVILNFSSSINWIFKNNSLNSNNHMQDNYLEKLLELILKSDKDFLIYGFATKNDNKLTTEQKTRLVDAIIRTKGLGYEIYFACDIGNLKREDWLKLSKSIITLARSFNNYGQIMYYFAHLNLKEIKLLKDMVIETKDKLVIICYIYYAKDFELLNEVFGNIDDYKEYCEKTNKIDFNVNDLNDFYLDAKFGYVDDNINNYAEKNSTAKSLK